jgi:hypothetical protein
VLVGGQSNGTRLNTNYKDLVHLGDLVREVTALFDHFKHERLNGETFGDFCQRIGVEGLRERADVYLAQHNGANHDAANIQGAAATAGGTNTGENQHAGHTVIA